MKVKWQGFAAQNHSWSVCAQSICRALLKSGHQVDIFSTNGKSFFPEDLIPHLQGHLEFISHGINSPKMAPHEVYGKEPGGTYDLQLTYTALKNAPFYLQHGKKNRFLIWTFEFAGKNALPDGFAKNHKHCDLLLPPSQFAKQVFADSGIPESKMKVIPHGIDFDLVHAASPLPLKTQKQTKIGMVIGQVHRRKNLAGMLEMYGKAFNRKDDVCLVIKVQDRLPTQPFELSFGEILKNFNHRFPQHAEIEVLRDFTPNIFSFYKSCDIIFYATNCEGFGMIGLEALAAGKINICSRYGGVLDFCNDQNSLLVDGKEFIVPPNYLYWSSKVNTRAFQPSIDDGVEKLRYAVANKEQLLECAQTQIPWVQANYTWDHISKQITNLVQDV